MMLLIGGLIVLAATAVVGPALATADGGNGPAGNAPPPTPAPDPGPRRDDANRVKDVVQSIVRVFESGHPDGRYDAIVILPDSAGISYGISQGTDRSGTLDRIVRDYIAAGGAFARELAPYLPRLQRDETASVDPQHPPAWVRQLMALLVDAAADPVMQRVQNSVFTELYWRPALTAARSLGLRHPLSLAVVYDTWIHSGPQGLSRIRRLFDEVPPAAGGDEQAWTTAYVRARRNWLSRHPRAAVRATTYRMDAFGDLIAAANWSLHTPIRIARPRATIS